MWHKGGRWVGAGVGWRRWVIGLGYPSDTMGPAVCQISHHMAPKPHYKPKQAV